MPRVQYEKFVIIRSSKPYFNILPADIRNSLGCTLETFRKGLDKYLHTVLDQPGCNGYGGLLAAASNSLNELRSNTTALSKTEMLGKKKRSYRKVYSR